MEEKTRYIHGMKCTEDWKAILEFQSGTSFFRLDQEEVVMKLMELESRIAELEADRKRYQD